MQEIACEQKPEVRARARRRRQGLITHGLHGSNQLLWAHVIGCHAINSRTKDVQRMGAQKAELQLSGRLCTGGAESFLGEKAGLA